MADCLYCRKTLKGKKRVCKECKRIFNPEEEEFRPIKTYDHDDPPPTIEDLIDNDEIH